MHKLAQDRHDSRMAIFQSGNESAKGRALTALELGQVTETGSVQTLPSIAVFK
jgi:hypothetical protein